MIKNKKFSFWFLFMMTITATLGSSLLISFNFVTSLSDKNPWLMIVSWIIGGVFILPETLLMLEPSVSFKVNGTAYGWLRRAKWNNIAFWFGWILVAMVASTAIAGASLAVGQIIAGLCNINNSWLVKLIGIIILLVLASLQLFLKNSSSVLQIIFTILTVAPIVFVMIFALIYGDYKHLENENITKGIAKSYISSMLLIPAISYTMFAYSGIEVSTYVVKDSEKPERNIPLVIISSIITIVIIYLVYGFALISLVDSSQSLGDRNSEQQVPFNLSNIKFPDYAKFIFNILAIFLFVGSINSYLIYHTKLVTKLSEEGDLFKRFLIKTKKTNISWLSMLLLIIMAVFYMLTNNLFNIVGYFGFAVSGLKIIMVTCICYLRLKDLEYKKIYNNITFYFLLIFAYISCILTLVGAILSMVLFKQTNKIWIPITILLVAIAIYPFSYLKSYIQKKYFVNKKNKLI